ncbi:glycosyltransferase involved in cell wall biosynthesis [Curtobacterium sp. 320]|uniref:glycosyltransferase family 4 protein n=1 Tax=Curtobacterium sp. 320 TaxID=2817749 RepID=UPI00285B109D|nr:glycosyltransferase family 4 protein [Curtobacterium sp. 320]MDR6574591.1 glycosyltransferase involved in cell wall biosynthesis [Curtobacterium sp. 320]
MTHAPERPDRRLRIAVVTNGLAITGGVERCVLEDTRELVRAGQDVEVWHRGHLAPGPDGAEPGSDQFAELGVTLHRTGNRSFGLRSAAGDAARFVLDGLRLRRSRPDVIWLNRPEHLPWGRVASVVSGVPLVVHLHHAPNYRRLGPIAGGRTHYLAVSHAMARAWADVGIPASRITVVPNGVDTALFPAATPSATVRARRTLGLDDDTRTVLYYGRLTRSKGVLALLEAWRLVLEQDAERHRARAPRAAVRALTPALGPAGTHHATQPHHPPVLVLAGAAAPDDAEDVRRAVASLPAGSVVLLPERDDVVTLLHAADMVVVPSIEPEGFGRVVVEAMSAGRPVVAAESGGTGEILAGEWATSTVDPTDPEALATKVLDTLDRADRDPSLGERCRAWVRDHYGRGPHVAGLLRALLTHARR